MNVGLHKWNGYKRSKHSCKVVVVFVKLVPISLINDISVWILSCIQFYNSFNSYSTSDIIISQSLSHWNNLFTVLWNFIHNVSGNTVCSSIVVLS